MLMILDGSLDHFDDLIVIFEIVMKKNCRVESLRLKIVNVRTLKLSVSLENDFW